MPVRRFPAGCLRWLLSRVRSVQVGDLAAAKAALTCSAVIINLVAAPLEAASLLQGEQRALRPFGHRRATGIASFSGCLC